MFDRFSLGAETRNHKDFEMGEPIIVRQPDFICF